MIAQSVGNQGVNHVQDTVIMQCALNAFRLRNGQSVIAVDGLVGPETIGAITEFQRQHGLTIDGRVDPGGSTLPRLMTAIGGAEGVFGPSIAQLLPLIDALRKLSRTAPPGVRRQINRLATGYDELNRFRDLAAGLGNGGGSERVQLASFTAGPRVIGFVGADDAAAAAAVAAMALILAIFLVLLIQNPAFRREVQIRAKELDRIMKNLQINANTSLKDAVDLVIAVANGTIEERNRCRRSPTFLASPACTAATAEFTAVVERLRVTVATLFRLVRQLTTERSGFSNLMAIRLQFNTLLVSAQRDAFELQVVLAHMREVCKCPDV